jgi:hypothetical protein
MKSTEDLWGKFAEFERVETETSASIQLLQPKQKKTLCTEKEFDEVFSDFFGNVKKN